MCFVTGLNIKTNKLILRDMWMVGYHFPILNVIFVVSKSFLKRKREEKLKGKIITDQDNVSYPGVIYPFYKVLNNFSWTVRCQTYLGLQYQGVSQFCALYNNNNNHDMGVSWPVKLVLNALCFMYFCSKIGLRKTRLYVSGYLFLRHEMFHTVRVPV